MKSNNSLTLPVTPPVFISLIENNVTLKLSPNISTRTMGSDPVKCMLLKDNQLINRAFLLLEGTFWGQKQHFKIRYGPSVGSCLRCYLPGGIKYQDFGFARPML